MANVRERAGREEDDEVRTAGLEAALDALGAAAFLVRQDGHLLRANAAGWAMVREDGAALTARFRAALAPTAVEEQPFEMVRLAVRSHVAFYLVLIRGHAAPPAARLEALRKLWSLTARQRDVLTLLSEGHANKTIASRLGIALATVEVHVTAVLKKAKCASRNELVAKVWGERIGGGKGA